MSQSANQPVSQSEVLGERRSESSCGSASWVGPVLHRTVALTEAVVVVGGGGRWVAVAVRVAVRVVVVTKAPRRARAGAALCMGGLLSLLALDW